MKPMKYTLIVFVLLAVGCTTLTEEQKEERAYEYQVAHEEYLRDKKGCTEVWTVEGRKMTKRRPTLSEMEAAECMDRDDFMRSLARQMSTL